MAPLISQLLPASLYLPKSVGASAANARDVSKSDRSQFIASPAEDSLAAKPLLRSSGMILAPAEGKIELYTPKYYGVCAVGGIYLTPLDRGRICVMALIKELEEGV